MSILVSAKYMADNCIDFPLEIKLLILSREDLSAGSSRVKDKANSMVYQNSVYSIHSCYKFTLLTLEIYYACGLSH